MKPDGYMWGVWGVKGEGATGNASPALLRQPAAISPQAEPVRQFAANLLHITKG